MKDVYKKRALTSQSVVDKYQYINEKKNYHLTKQIDKLKPYLNNQDKHYHFISLGQAKKKKKIKRNQLQTCKET